MSAVHVDVGRYSAVHTCRDGLFLINRFDLPIGASLAYYGEYSRGEQELFAGLIKPDYVVIEAGAHIGSHTVGLSRLCKRLYAFEPQRLPYQMMCANLALNECANVHAYQVAVGREPGAVRVPIFDHETRPNTGGVILGDVAEGEDVQVVTLDSIRIDFAFLKADVEEMELDVILGAQETIARCRPILYLESNRNHRPLFELVTSLGYAMYWHFPKLFSVENFNGRTDELFEPQGIVSLNVLCIPLERPSDIQWRRIKLTDACVDAGVSIAGPGKD